MPIVDGVLDIPALEWCSIREAILWMEFGQIPVSICYESALADRISSLALVFDENMRTASCRGLCMLAALVSLENGVKIRGCPAERVQRVTYDSDGLLHVDCETWGKPTEIPLSLLKDNVSEFAFDKANMTGVLMDSRLFSTEERPDSFWAYSEVTVSFRDLIRLFPKDGSEDIRIGGEARIISPPFGTKLNKPGLSKETVTAETVSLKCDSPAKAEISTGEDAVDQKQNKKSKAVAKRRLTRPDPDRACESVDEFCAAMGIGRTTFYNDRNAGKIKTIPRGRRTLVPLTERQAYLRRLSGEEVG